jgi:hypothetical protein
MSYATLMVYVDVEGKPDGRVSIAASRPKIILGTAK